MIGMAKRKMKLTLDHIVKEDEKYEQLVKVAFDNGTYTEIYKKFRPTRVEQMLEDFASFIDEYEKTGKVMKDTEAVQFISLHIVQYFSTLIDALPADIHEKISLYHKMLDSNLVEIILASFDENEVMKIYETIYKKLDMHQKQMLDSNLQERVNVRVAQMEKLKGEASAHDHQEL
jgi:hypothetical protein